MSTKRVVMRVANGDYGSILVCDYVSTCRFVEKVDGYTPEQIMSMAEAHYADTGHDHI